MERRWISVNECAAALSLHPMSIRKMISRGTIPDVRVGRAVRIDCKSLTAQLEEQISNQVVASRAKGGTR